MILKEIRETVRIIKQYYPGLSALDVLNELKVVTSFLVDTTETKLPDGCYFKLDNVKFVLINPSLSEHERNRVYAHELGHALFHPNINTLNLENYDKLFVKKLELEADKFCCEFLLDDNVFSTYEGYSNSEIAKIFGITTELVDLKFNNLDKLNLIEKPNFSVM
ncbi:ImmA/IrrE family metallo-endopeptidase [Romboutsia sp. CE17]|uniref:ImmA/IrrE family metallo-endopeptidase n=1 Tax=Romboutsia sp. CE17 TaxID=2724150 RepID=UPI001442C0F7|nr:ImmA/IrrE family metallo-endopeptidase [Romboutsia sp. CE17]QJA09098.1 ImmA/IrrE family metallo-endopeptidase [Romboutsia sp. CE17]